MTTPRKNISSGTPWEEEVGYSRAVRVGRHVFVTGTLAADEKGEMTGVGDPYAQTVACIRKIERALHDAGATLDDVVRTRMYVTDIDQWREIGKAHHEFFGHVKPAATMIEIQRLFTPDAIIEIEADAVVDG